MPLPPPPPTLLIVFLSISICKKMGCLGRLTQIIYKEMSLSGIGCHKRWIMCVGPRMFLWQGGSSRLHISKQKISSKKKWAAAEPPPPISHADSHNWLSAVGSAFTSTLWETEAPKGYGICVGWGHSQDPVPPPSGLGIYIGIQLSYHKAFFIHQTWKENKRLCLPLGTEP